MKGVLLQNGKYTVSKAWTSALEQIFGADLSNKSHFGCTVEKAMPSIEKYISEREGKSGESYLLIEFGGNDCDYKWAEIAEDPAGAHKCNTPIEKYSADMRAIVTKAADAGIKPAIITLPPIDAEKYLSFICRNGIDKERILDWLIDAGDIEWWQGTYSSMARQIAREEAIPVIDLRSAVLGSGVRKAELTCDDGIHLSPEGQQIALEQFSRFAGEYMLRKVS